MLADQGIFQIALLIVFILVSLTVHEFMHAYVGHLLGDQTAHDAGRVSLNPLKHIDPLMTVLLPIVTILLAGTPILAARPVPFDPRFVKYEEFGAAMIAAAGPVSNLLLAIIGAVLGHVLDPASGSTLYYAIELFTVLNVGLFVFNILPIPPLDGSRVLYAFAPEPLQELMERIEPYGLMVIFALVLLGGLNGVITHLDQLVLNLLP